MTQATKQKLQHWDIDSEVADALESVGIISPLEIREATDDQLKKAGLTKTQVDKVRKKLPKDK